MFVLSDISGILLDSIKIFGIENSLQLGNVITWETDFYIRTINGKMTVYPTTQCNTYYLIAKRVVNAKTVVISSLDAGMRGDEKMLSDNLPRTNANPAMPLAKMNNGRNCRDCSKSNVCKYQEVVTEEVERLIGELEKKELPLSVNINCDEFLQKQIVGIR